MIKAIVLLVKKRPRTDGHSNYSVRRGIVISPNVSFANLNELNCNSTIVLDMLTDQIESVKMYGSITMKKYN
jgi:hypothetical protein